MIGTLTQRKGFDTVFRPFADDRETLGDGDPVTPPVDPALALTAQTSPRYEIRGVLGRGGMGEVRLCHDSRVGRDVAVKVAHEVAGGAGTATVRARFMREARIQGQLEHPAIVPVHDLEVLDDGSLYFVMKRVRGRTLGDIIAALAAGDATTQERYPLRRLLAAFNSVCLAVEFAHSRGVVHRDLKPGNVMLGDFGEIYVLDWGLAKVLHAPDDANDLPGAAEAGETIGRMGVLTEAGHMLGTPGFMAPEQIDAGLGPVGVATDVYALGAVLFELLTLRPWIAARDPLEATITTLNGSGTSPAARFPTAHVPPTLDAACARALALSPAARLSSARALHDVIDDYLAGEHDRERRQAQSRLASQDAERALASAGGTPPTDDVRKLALRDLGSALAFDPDNAEARRTLVALLTSPPVVTPPEVLRRIAQGDQVKVHEAARLTTLVAAVCALFLVAVVPMGVLDWLPVVVALLGVTSAFLLNIVMLRSARPSRIIQTLALLSFLIYFGSVSTAFGPLILLPSLLGGTAMVLQQHPDQRGRTLDLVLCLLALGFLLALELGGFTSRSYAITEGGILVRERMVALGVPALVFLSAASFAAILLPSIFARSEHDALAAAERKLAVQAWQMEQLIRPPAGLPPPVQTP